MDQPALDQLCAVYGISNEYYDVHGGLHPTSDTTKRRLLQAMGVDMQEQTDLESVLHAEEARRWQQGLERVCVSWEGEDRVRLLVTVPEGEREQNIYWRLSTEGGQTSSGRLVTREFEEAERRLISGDTWLSMKLTVPVPSEIGYHRLQLHHESASDAPFAETFLIRAPARCYRPPELDDDWRLWGLTAQLYGLRSQRNLGVGDFTDLMRLVEFAAKNGAAFVGLNPLHSPLTAALEHTSPYDPSSRLFLNALYLDVEAIPEFAESEAAAQLVAEEKFQAQVRSLRATDLVAWPEVGALKFRVLEALFREFRHGKSEASTARRKQFDEFRRSRGDLLQRYAAFQVVHEYCREQDPSAWGWPAWPEEFQDWRSKAVTELLQTRQERLQFFMYLQWNASNQLLATAERARELGMPIGIYADLALSSKYGGADTWMHRDLFSTGARIGAPPDTFNQSGQDWGLPPWNPSRLREREYRPFIEMLRANMRIGGALRIDHVMALLRCYLIPPGAGPAEGAYVYYPFEEMRAILALESQRHRCLVIGEDLGTVPEEVREGLGRIGVLGYRVLFFEKRPDGTFKAPEEFDSEVLTVISTHDLPTLVGFWEGADIDWRSQHDLYARDEDREQQIVQRAEDRARLLVALEKNQLASEHLETELPERVEMTLELRCAFHRYLGRSSSRLAGVQVEDLLGERDQANLPGTTDEHPNWRRRLSLQIESWSEERQVQDILAVVREERPPAESDSQLQLAAAVTPRVAVIPRATYRVQLHEGFGFADLEQLVPYFAALGISHLYCSPYMKARSGSKHGYDVVNHNALNPELGEREDFNRLCRTLHDFGMSQILDMVPNHMAITGRDHDWWLDVLENGPASRYADFFDIDWQPLKEELRGKVLLPVLGDHYGNILDHGELKLVFDASRGSFAVEYYEHQFPIDPREYVRILKPELELLRRRLDPAASELVLLESLITAFGNLPPRWSTDDESRHERARDQKLHQGRLAEMFSEAPDIRRYISDCLRVFNGDEQYPADTSRLHQLLEAQAYRLAFWRVASHEINYRRFFDINDLASIRMENPEVFEATHQLVFELISSGVLQGLRIDHPDGLYDPRGYFQDLQQRAGFQDAEDDAAASLPLYLLAEKILAADEKLRDDWPIHGTTGYEFANLVNRFLVQPEGLDRLESLYTDFIGRQVTYEETLHRSKSLIMRTSLASELNVLVAELDRLAEQDPHTRDFGLGGLRNALFETVAFFPVYRTYAVDGEVSEADQKVINHAVDAAKRESEAADTSVFEFFRDLLLNRSAVGRSAALQERIARFGMRLQQYTSPVAAKGMEDTAFYRYGRLISLNEVGGTPEAPAASVEELHSANLERRENWPHSMLASSTHDAKRSEDVRARLHVLSELAAEWGQHARLWAEINEPLKSGEDGIARVDPETEWFLYQTLVGAWPLSSPGGQPDDFVREDFQQRMNEYTIKAVKEAKRRTSWLNPDEDYEEGLKTFISAVLEPASNAPFMADFLPFQRRVARLGLMNALSQLVLKFGSPGVPDIYQGNELWRFDLVDPDNRRPVDFARRKAALEDMQEGLKKGRGRDLVAQLVTSIEDGRLKLYVTWRALVLRGQFPELFRQGTYRPLKVEGDRRHHVFAFARQYRGVTLVVAGLRWFSELVGSDGVTLDVGRLNQTVIELPPGHHAYVNLFSDDPVNANGHVAASAMFEGLPVAMWVCADTCSTSSGSSV